MCIGRPGGYSSGRQTAKCCASKHCLLLCTTERLHRFSSKSYSSTTGRWENINNVNGDDLRLDRGSVYLVKICSDVASLQLHNSTFCTKSRRSLRGWIYLQECDGLQVPDFKLLPASVREAADLWGSRRENGDLQERLFRTLGPPSVVVIRVKWWNRESRSSRLLRRICCSSNRHSCASQHSSCSWILSHSTMGIKRRSCTRL